MDKYVQPLMDATEKTFEMMLARSVRFHDPAPIKAFPTNAGVSGVIGLSGDVSGAIAVSFPTQTALAVVSAFCSMQVELGSEDFIDAVGEIANMIAGAAKAEFLGLNVSISCPTVIIGEGHMLQRPSTSKCWCVPCECDLGRFIVEITVASQVQKSSVKAA